ncbi:MAG: hypothetical protein IJ600_12700 [Lachnospiraceae bacterium]|nr:hypothetical protein [Lachnospiraceae bacterium]
MKISDFNNISMNGRMAYAILCVEKYLKEKYPDDNWDDLSKLMWTVTSIYWDEWDNKFIEIIPEYLFEFNSYAESDFEEISEDEYNSFVALLRDKSDTINQLLMKLHKIQEVYSYSSIPDNGKEASQLVLDIYHILEQGDIALPDLDIVSFSNFSERDGWGNKFDGTKLSLILNK